MAQNPRHRAPSRASTASMHSMHSMHSIHSTNSHGNLDQSFAVSHVNYPDQWNGHGHTRELAAPGGHHMPAEDMMMRPAPQMHSGHPYNMDSSMQSSVGGAMPYAQHAPMNHMQHHMAPDPFAASASFAEPDSHMMDREDNDDGDSLAGLAMNGKPSSNKTSANNELEMRQLFQANKHRTLQEVASELHGNDRGPNSERARQVFAMLWINDTCSKGKGSVPRGRVYANYASRCASERTTVLNPASFGKLVRVLHPGLKTRRLGVRGESKYHYVNFTLADDHDEHSEPAIQPAIPFPDPASFAQNFDQSRSHSPAVNPARATLPSPEVAQGTTTTAPSRADYRSHSLYNTPDVSSIDQLHATTSKTALRLSLAPFNEELFRQSDVLPLPNILAYVPDANPDDAATLRAIYLTHLTSIVESIRYCKQKTFFHQYTSFQGTMTLPVQRLLSNSRLVPWIEQCDLICYQRMMRILSGLTLQVVPKPVLDTLRNISERLIPHIRETMTQLPKHVLEARERPATLFAGLLDRALRVNLTAHAAANMLSNPANRDQMYVDWIMQVRIRKVAECVPTRAMDDLVSVLLGEVRNLLDPQNVPWEMECLTVYGDLASRDGRHPQTGNSGNESAQGVIDRWVDFLRSLPARFPYARDEDIVWSVQRVGTEVMRDITINQGKSFGSWWVTKCWLDEMVAFMAEQGGFMTLKTCPLPQPSVAKRGTPPAKGSNAQAAHYNGNMEELDFNANAAMVSVAPQTQSNRAPFPPPVDTSNGMPMNADDSGIGMRTPEEEAPMEKFELGQDHGPGLQHVSLGAGY